MRDNSEPFLDFCVLDMMGEKEFTEFMHWPFWGNSHYGKKRPEGVTSFKIVRPTSEQLGLAGEAEHKEFSPWLGFPWLVIWRNREEPSEFNIYLGIYREIRSWIDEDKRFEN